MLIAVLLLGCAALVTANDSLQNAFVNRYERQAHVDTTRVPDVTATPTPPSATTTPCTTTAAEAPNSESGEGKCGASIEKLWLDIVVVVDNSQAMGQEIRAAAAQLNTLFAKVPLNKTANQFSRIALLTYNRKVQLVGAFNKYNSSKDLFRDLMMLKSSTEPVVDLSTALKKAQETFEETASRPNVQRAVLVVAAEYDSTGLNNPLGAALQLKESGVSIIAIAHRSTVGGQFASKLAEIASSNMFFVNNHASVYTNVRKAFCYVNCYCKRHWQTYKPPFDVNAREFYGECVYFVEAPADRESAESVCPFMENGHLVHMKSASKHDLLLSMIKKFDGGDEFHVGLRRERAGSPWRWAGEPQEKTHKGIPPTLWRDGNGADCGVGVRANDTALYEGRSCSEGVYSYFCQSKICDTDNYCEKSDLVFVV